MVEYQNGRLAANHLRHQVPYTILFYFTLHVCSILISYLDSQLVECCNWLAYIAVSLVKQTLSSRFICRKLINPHQTGFCNSLVAMKMATQWTILDYLPLRLIGQHVNSHTNYLINYLTYLYLAKHKRLTHGKYTMCNKINIKFYVCIQSSIKISINSTRSMCCCTLRGHFYQSYLQFTLKQWQSASGCVMQRNSELVNV